MTLANLISNPACPCRPTTVDTCCCSDNPIPVVLSIEFFDVTIPLGSTTLTFTGTGWNGTVTICGQEMGLTLACGTVVEDCEWTLATTLFGISNSYTEQCDPFELEFREIETGGIYCEPLTIQALVTA